jgi:hypothetical protein
VPTKAINGQTRWHFVRAADQTWSWQYSDILSDDPLPSLAAAIEDAKFCGVFDPVREYWTVTKDGATMHHRPGKTSVNTPAGMELED